MKMNITKIIFAALAAMFILVSCSPDDFKDIGPARDISSSFAGSWKLTKVVQRDEDAGAKAFPYAELDLTAIFPYTDFKLTLNGNGTGTSTFTTTPGNSPKIIGLASGDWTLDDAKNPGAITFKNGAITELVTLSSYPVGGNSKLKFKAERRDEASNKLLVSYTYEFSKQ